MKTLGLKKKKVQKTKAKKDEEEEEATGLHLPHATSFVGKKSITFGDIPEGKCIGLAIASGIEFNHPDENEQMINCIMEHLAPTGKCSSAMIQ